MPRAQTPAEIVAFQMDQLSGAIRKLLVDNRNYVRGDDNLSHYGRETPRTDAFIAGPLRRAAEHLIGQVAQAREVVVVQAADPDVPGLARVHEGELHGYRVRLEGRPDGTWSMSLAIDGAFHDRDDVEATFPDESAAIAAARDFARTGVLPEGDAQAPAPGR